MKTPFAKATDTRMPADDGFAAACDFWGPTDPDVSGNRLHMLIVELKFKQMGGITGPTHQTQRRGT